MRRERAVAATPLWLLCSLSAMLLAAAPAAAMQVTIDGIDVRKVPSIKAYVTVLSSSGETIKGLREDNFVVQDEIIDAGPPTTVTPVTVKSALQSGESLGLVLVLDRSGSMKGQPLADAKTAASDFLTRLGISDRAAVLSFSTQLRTDCEATTDRTKLKGAIKQLSSGGDTALYDAAKKAAHMAAKIGGVTRRAVILLTDGQRTHGAATPDAAISVATGEGVRFYTIGLGRQPDHASLHRLASATGGIHLQAAGSGDLMGVYQKIADRLQNQYVVKFSRNTDVRFHRLHVTVKYRGYAASDNMAYWPSGVAGAESPDSSAATSVASASAAAESKPEAVARAKTEAAESATPTGPLTAAGETPEPPPMGPQDETPEWITVAALVVVGLVIVLMVTIVAVVAKRR